MTRKEWAALSPEEQRIKVAELCGWSQFRTEYMAGYFKNMLVGHYRRQPSSDCSGHPVPNYLGDLNAMHEAETHLPDAHVRRRYYQTLDQITGDQWNTTVATARQRAEALVLTLGPE